MSGLRLVLITRRFWPLVGGAERAMGNLAAGFQAAGHKTTLLTAHWLPHWPTAIEHHGVRVERLSSPAARFWGTWRYMRSVRRWLLEHREEVDLVLVSMLKHDAYSAISACGGNMPIVLRAEGAGATGDCQWQQTARFGGLIRHRCRQATAVIAPSPAVQQELLTAGYPLERLEFIPNGVPLGPVANSPRRKEARTALGTGHPALSLSAETPLVVYTGRLHPAKGLERLVDAWPRVMSQVPDARLWLVGEGPLHARLAGQITRLKLQGFVLLTGSFDNVDELLAAADAFVLPSLEESMSLALLEAMAQGLPIVASDIPGNRNLVVHEQHGLLAAPEDPEALADSITRLLNNRPLAHNLGEAARDRVRRYFPLDKMVDRHLRLFERLLSSAGSRT